MNATGVGSAPPTTDLAGVHGASSTNPINTSGAGKGYYSDPFDGAYGFGDGEHVGEDINHVAFNGQDVGYGGHSGYYSSYSGYSSYSSAYSGYSGSGSYGYSGGNYGGGNYGGGNYGGGYAGGYPVALDLAGKGIKVVPRSQSNMFFDMAGDGLQHHTAWAGAGNGVLVLDTQGNGKITQQNQVVFTKWDPSARNDLQALLDVFDTNHDGMLDAGDAKFSSFKVWVTKPDGTNTNADGSPYLRTLAQLGITSINLRPDQTEQVLPDGSSIDGETTYTKTDGTTGTAATVSFNYDTNGYALATTTTTNADGSITIDNKEYNPDGSLAGEIVSTTSADGLTKTIKIDSNGDAIFDTTTTDVTVRNNGGSTTETLTDKDTSGVETDATVTTTSADGKTITVLRDTDGNGVTDQKEVDATAADGSKSVTVTDLNPDGSVVDSVVHTVSADGLTGTTKTDLNGDGVYDTTISDVTTNRADGSTIETITDKNADGSTRDLSTTTTNANATSQVVSLDEDGNGTVDLTKTFTITQNADKSTTTKEVDTNGDGSTRSITSTTISADGLTTTTQQDVNGDGKYDTTRTDSTVIRTDGSHIETISDANAKGTLLDQTVIKIGADGITRTRSVDSNGDGLYDSINRVSVDNTGIVTDVLSSYQPDGKTITGTRTTTISADKMIKTVNNDFDGDGHVDEQTITATSTSATNGIVTTSDYGGSGNLLDKTRVNTASSGLTMVTQQDLDGDGVYDTKASVSTKVLTNGSRSTIASVTSTNGTLESASTTVLSADRNTTTISSDTNGDGVTDQVETIAKQANGDTIDTVKLYALNNNLYSTSTITTAANGLSTTTSSDVDGDGTIDASSTDVTVLNNDGSQTETVTSFGKGGGLLSRSVTQTSATGLLSATSVDIDGSGSTDQTTRSITTLNSDGSQTTVVTVTSPTASGGIQTLSSVTKTASANGRSIAVASDLNGDGSIDRTSSDVLTSATNGKKIETVSDKAQNGALVDQTITNSAGHGTVTIARNLDGQGSADDVETIAARPDGGKVDTDRSYDRSGNLIQSLRTISSGNGDSIHQTLDADADGTIDEKRNDVTVFNSDGSTTETVSDVSLDADIQVGSSLGDTVNVATTTSGNGLSITTALTSTNSGVSLVQRSNSTVTDVTVLGADGSTTDTVTIKNTSSAALLGKEVTTNAAHGLSQTVQLDEFGTGTYNVTDATVLNSDGSTTETYTANAQSGSLIEKDVTTTSANGLSINVQRDTDGDGHVDQAKTTIINSDGSRVDTISSMSNSGTLLDKTTAQTSADGRTTTTSFDYDGDGVVDATTSQVASINTDGSTTNTRSDYIGSALRDQIVTTTSANGFTTTGTIDLNGDGIVDENYSNTITINADGTQLATVATTYADGTLKSKTTTATSANGRSLTIDQDLNGDGHVDVHEVDTTLSSGVKTADVTYLDATGKKLSETLSTTSADGTHETISSDFNGDGKQDAFSQEVYLNDGFGSYDITADDGGQPSIEANHMIDADGVDHILISGSTTPIVETLQQEGENLGELGRLYDVMLDRDPTAAEQQAYLGMTFRQLVTKVTTSTQFQQKYGTLTNSEFVEQMYQNAYGRSAKLSELNSWLSQLQAGTVARVDIVLTLSESAEHLTDGNTHAVTNNSDVISGQNTLDHTLDKQVAANTVDRLYLTSLGRHADSTSSSTNSQQILNGSITEAQIANNLIKSAEFTSDYGTLNDPNFVKTMFQNGLHRAPTSSELAAWTQLLQSGAISRADLVVGIADSPDQLAVANSGSNATPMVMAAFAKPASPASQTSSSNVNQMIQAMSALTATSAASSSPMVATPPEQPASQLAAAHR